MADAANSLPWSTAESLAGRRYRIHNTFSDLPVPNVTFRSLEAARAWIGAQAHPEHFEPIEERDVR